MKNKIDRVFPLVLNIFSFVFFLVIAILGTFKVAQYTMAYKRANDSLYTMTTLGIIFVPVMAFLFVISIIFLARHLIKGKQNIFDIIISFISSLLIGGVANALAVMVIIEGTTSVAIAIIVFSFALALVEYILAIFYFSKDIALTKKMLKEMRPAVKNDTKEKIIAIESLNSLKKLLDSGVITKEEFDEKRKKYIDLL